MFRAIAGKDFDALHELLAEDVTSRIVGSGGGPIAGRAEVRERVVEAARGTFAQLEDQRPEILSVVAQGDTSEQIDAPTPGLGHDHAGART